jgi:methionyl aminopeptidase
MSIKTTEELEKLKAIGRIVRESLDAMAAAVRAGISTQELDEIGLRVLRERDAEPAPAKVYGFPGSACISVNDEAVHGIPGARVLQDGDIVKLDLVACNDGFFADAAVTVRVGKVSPTADALIRCAESAFRKAVKVARVGFRAYDIGRAVERETRRFGFNVMPDLGGHGVGRTIHETPNVPNYFEPRSSARLTEGLVLAVEPIVTNGSGRAVPMRDGWTIRTADRTLAAHYEHTIVITRGEPILVTA